MYILVKKVNFRFIYFLGEILTSSLIVLLTLTIVLVFLTALLFAGTELTTLRLCDEHDDHKLPLVHY